MACATFEFMCASATPQGKPVLQPPQPREIFAPQLAAFQVAVFCCCFDGELACFDSNCLQAMCWMPLPCARCLPRTAWTS